jgi:GNAT superfamily N-acetyltransferase
VVLTVKVEKLKVNFKTLEEFKRFKEYGIQELSMLEDLEHQMVEHESDSPFYGIYFGDKLVARMSLYQVDAKSDRYFYPPQSYFELWKLEVLPQYQKKGFGKILVDFAKEFGLPIKVNPKVQSADFWEKMDFKTVEYEMDRDLGENPLVWYPKGVEAQ